jgi:ParB family chromosome partitioning protein
LAKERALRDNNSFGEWQEQDLAEMLAGLQLQGADLDALGFDKDFLNGLVGEPSFDPVSEDEQGRLDQKKPVQCPECGYEFVPQA